MQTKSAEWWEKSLRAALADDRNQPIEEFRLARDAIFKNCLHDAAEDPNYDASATEARIRRLFGPSPDDISSALAKLHAVRMLFDGR